MLGDIIGCDDLAQVLALLCGRYVVDTACGRIRVIADRLEAGGVSAILPSLGDGIMRIVVDPEQPNAYAHARQMLREWWESYTEPKVTSDGHVELVTQRAPVEDRRRPMPLYTDA